MNTTVSVIIPIYKVEKYMSRCIDSALKQTLKDIEIILVDDGSPDSCPELCDDYAAKEPRIKVIHKKNGGLASARNAGMRAAEGKYIFFVDSDDWIDENTLEELVQTAEQYNVDFVRYRPMYAGWPGREDGSLCDFGTERGMKEGLYQKKDMIRDIYPRLFATSQLILGVIVSACRSLYRRSLLIENDLYFDEVQYNEDTIFSARVVMAAKSFYYLDGPRYYHYFYNPASITKSFRADRWEEYKKLMKCFDSRFAGLKEYDFSNQLWLQKIFCVVSAMSQRSVIKDMKEREEYCRKICEDEYTVAAFRHLKLVQPSSWRQRVFFELIRLKQAKILARI